MNYQNIYNNINQRLKDSILSLWSTGDVDMQQAYLELFKSEPLMSEPVIQNSFPWEAGEMAFGEMTDLFGSHFIKSLNDIRDEDARFSSDIYPYKHQVASWNSLLKANKSIAVTTGTGSGKTECFMLPILADLYHHRTQRTGVKAIFLYPLNALINSQITRMESWLRAIGGVNFAVYTGDTPTDGQVNLQKTAYPRILTRAEIRRNPPPILFTNPTMLEYMMVRDKDVSILQQSQGTLRWIVMDEAHTLTGSSAAEMSLLIRRVVDAFGVQAKDIRFAITSATVGQGENAVASLKEFMSKLCGIEQSQIEVITGQRKFEELTENPLPHYDLKEIQDLRYNIREKDSLRIGEIAEKFNVKGTENALALIDELAECSVDGKPILPVRGHFFGRSLGGIYVCTNKDCTDEKLIKSPYGRMTTFAAHHCTCGHPMVELVACRSCGNELMMADRITDRSGDRIQLTTSVVNDNFNIDDYSGGQDEDQEEENDVANVTTFFFTRQDPKRHIDEVTKFQIAYRGNLDCGEGEYLFYLNDQQVCACPHCHSQLEAPLHFRLSSSFVNRILADLFLEATPEMYPLTKDMQWNGHKYISFTDSRQGTAKISALLNIDTESNWIRAQVYHKLLELNSAAQLSGEDIEGKRWMLANLEQQLNEQPPYRHSFINKQIQDIQNELDQLSTNEVLRWDSLLEFLRNRSDATVLLKNNSLNKDISSLNNYLKGILYDEFARRLPRSRSIENLGMIGLDYPTVDTCSLPAICDEFKIDLIEYRNLVKIAADYIIRYPFHFEFDPGLYNYSVAFMRSKPIYPIATDQGITGVTRWPSFNPQRKRQHRFVTLLCAGLGFHNFEEITPEDQDRIDQLLQAIWGTLVSKNVLSNLGDNSYKLRLEESTVFCLTNNVWLCPVKKRLINRHFRGYSPWISGNLSADTIEHFRIKQGEIKFPHYEYPFNMVNNVLDNTLAQQWMSANSSILKEKGVWNDLHERIIRNRPIYLAGEHSAQQNRSRLDDLEAKFIAGKVNILNCSTTMEMGVDLKGISVVMMNNVPPGPANYLQRAGRAGRRSEAKSLAFTTCAPTPIGNNVLREPDWALKHAIAAPRVDFHSTRLIQRHVNSYFFGKYVQENANGIAIMNKLLDIFPVDGEELSVAEQFNNWLNSPDIDNYISHLKHLTKFTPLQDVAISSLVDHVLENFRKVLDETSHKVAGFQRKIMELTAEFGEDGPATRSVKRQYFTFINQNAISYLVSAGFLPSAGMPTGVVEFDNTTVQDYSGRNNNSENIDKGPSHFITRALMEYAPGTRVVIDGKSFTSAGVVLSNHTSEAVRELIRICEGCGYQEIISVDGEVTENEQCPHCKAQGTFKGIRLTDVGQTRFTQLIEPVGFAVDMYAEPSRKITERSEVHYVDPMLINLLPWTETSNSYFEIRESSSSNAEILYYNVGSGSGFSVCLTCGRASTQPSDLHNHTRLRGGKNRRGNQQDDTRCAGNDKAYAIRPNVILGGRFQTDYCEIRIKDGIGSYTADPRLLYTLGSVFVKILAQYLAIEAAELGFGIKKYNEYSTLFIFDTAKGGAGYAPQFSLYAIEIFKEALRTLEGCTCEAACTKCLIDRSTQWHMDNLDRHSAIAWLEHALNQIVPEDIKSLNDQFTVLIQPIKDELNTLFTRKKPRGLTFFVERDFQNWNLEELPFIARFSRMIGKATVVVKCGDNQPSIDEYIDLKKSENFVNYFENEVDDYAGLRLLVEIELQEGSYIRYYGRDGIIRSLNKDWSSSDAGQLYKLESTSQIRREPLEWLRPTEGNIAESHIVMARNQRISSNKIFTKLLEDLGNRIDLRSAMQGKKFDVTYSDRYCKSPMAVMLMFQFIESIKNEFNLDLNEFDFYSSPISDPNNRVPIQLRHNYSSDADRDVFIRSNAWDLEISNFDIHLEESLPHYRYFEFESDDIIVRIRPDGGIEHGWYCDDYTRYNNGNVSAFDVFNIKGYGDGNPILYTLSIVRK
ncbi:MULTISPECIES: DEAD/DEAH box helicase [unclassified Sphingobacterium]|uniref:DEAD/DEAH box helicase n=1 Tax=unclassified Sphingobacterium TaxID=2609468 RepID=UPI0025E698A7|nr:MULTISPECIES: DEAD/DEAH box helicase [unclassified Sphingobacterium]